MNACCRKYLKKDSVEHDEIIEIHDFIKEWQPKVVVNDVKNTSQEYMQVLSDAKVRTLNFDDLGPGAELADTIIDANRRENLFIHSFYR